MIYYYTKYTFLKTTGTGPGVHACALSTREAKVGPGVFACALRAKEAEVGSLLQVQGQHGLLREFRDRQSYRAKPCLKINFVETYF